MIIDFSNKNLKLHEWLYDIVTSITYDRDYAYYSYCRAFSSLMSQIFDTGNTNIKGDVEVYGIKSDYNANISYIMKHRLNYVGLNDVELFCKIFDKSSGKVLETYENKFELSLGETF